MAIEVGMTGEVEQVVTQDLTADALGNKGVLVYATPYVIGLMETAAQVADMLAERSKGKKSERPWAGGGAAKFGGLGAPAAAGASRKARGAGKKVPPSGS